MIIAYLMGLLWTISLTLGIPIIKIFRLHVNRVFNLIANVNKQLIAYFGQTQLIAIL